MTDRERESQLSAMFDGELPNAECELLARRLAKDSQMQRSWARYALIGTVLRSEPLARGDFAATVRRRMVESGAAATRSAMGSARRSAGSGSLASSWWVPLSGVGVAAGVATLAIFFGRLPSEDALSESRLAQLRAAEVVLSSAAPSLPAGSGVARGAEPLMLATTVSESVNGREPESYVTPSPEAGLALPVGISASLANYVVAHSSVSAPMLRHSTLSAFVTAELPEPVVPGDSLPVTDATGVAGAEAR